MKFKTAFKGRERKQETFNNKYQQTWKIQRDKKTGERKLVKDEKINIYEKIQEGAAELKIKNQIAKYDINTIKQIQIDKEKIIDLTEVPENLIESMNIIANAKSIFERQSKQIKQEFNNDYRQFIAASEDGRLKAVIDKYVTVQQAAPVQQAEPVQQAATVQQPIVTNGIIQGQQQMRGVNLDA